MVEISPPNTPVTFSAVITSEWVGALFPHTRLEVGGNRMDQKTIMQGGREAVSLGRAATGCGADLIVVDDLMMILRSRFRRSSNP